ncbi:MAG: NADH:ubiquinone reductase (Na(+)-transporting) subunit B [Candidatus Cloacimonadota bacterium]|nr:MAG: NADH:ubiquinone reductase (Na(+)-transporting) subunit B [Candidatus Cloacimonadota bacterium]PIE80619.1 MAG: NADH:ubiquinone reductase (Na(+)-transporting) subunit B [Candidatus Delongbacteria bacterium]
MKFLHNMLEKVKPNFEKGGKYEKLYPLFEMTETFLFSQPIPTKKGAHIRDGVDSKRFMTMVIYALMPAMLFGMYNIGFQHYKSIGAEASIFEMFIKGAWSLIPIYIVTFGVGGFWEMLFSVIRKHEINEGLLVTGFLIPLIVPPTIPLWQLAIAVSFGVVIAKEVFGGTGMNIFNPALMARAFLFFAYPKNISGNSVWTVFGDKTIDAYTSATPLSVVVEGSTTTTPVVDNLLSSGYSFMDMFLGFIPGSVGEVSTLAILLGAAFLIITGVGSWRIMLSIFVGGYLMALLMNGFAPDSSSLLAIPPHYHMVMGGFAFGAVFMATDPISASQTNKGKYIYGFLIGVIAIIIRSLNPAYPEGMMLSILFMNAFAPLIDHYIVAGNKKRRLNYGK